MAVEDHELDHNFNFREGRAYTERERAERDAQLRGPEFKGLREKAELKLKELNAA
jgi:hypothetical protein